MLRKTITKFWPDRVENARIAIATAIAKYVSGRFRRAFLLFVPPIVPKLYYCILRANQNVLPELPDEFANLPFAQHGLFKLIKDYQFENVLDIGSGSGEHANVLGMHGKKVTALDLGTSIYATCKHSEKQNVTFVEANFYEARFEGKFDCLWASHVLEHQPDPGVFIRRCMELAKENGVIAITVPPLKHQIVGGHLTLWNAGLLIYQLVFNGLDCREVAVRTYGYNVTVIVLNKKRPHVELTCDNGDIRLLQPYFPSFAEEPFEGQIESWNW